MGYLVAVLVVVGIHLWREAARARVRREERAREAARRFNDEFPFGEFVARPVTRRGRRCVGFYLPGGRRPAFTLTV